MGKFRDLSGQKFGRLTALYACCVLGLCKTNGCGAIHWLCACECGERTIVKTGNLTSGCIKSCGCLKKEIAKENASEQFTTHGKRYTKTYRIWAGMKTRCENPNNHKYHHYGGRGVSICQKWCDSFEQFLADMGECPPGMSIERIDNDAGYFPENCKWASYKEQARNRSNTRLIISKSGTKMCLSDWAEYLNVNVTTLHNWLKDYTIDYITEYKVGGKQI